MKQALKAILRTTPLYPPLRRWVVAGRRRQEIAAWEKRGKPVPPPHVFKQTIIRDFARAFDLQTFVETGTFRGDMVEAMKPRFERLYSIELSESLFEQARERFRGDERITIIHGDSGIELGALVPSLDRPALFRLDGHYSEGNTARGAKETPIYEELTLILEGSRQGDVILIDDARCFGRDAGYPTVAELRDFVTARKPGAAVEVEDDCIRVFPDGPDQRKGRKKASHRGIRVDREGSL